MNKNYGVIIHYGLYSVYGYDDINSARRRSTQNGSEWYYGRLIDTNTFRPISGHVLTKQYHKNNFGDMDYFERINEVVDDPEKIKYWITLCKENGCNYIILTSKHHDGLCLWNTETTTKKSNIDIMKIFKKECELQKIDFGIYYSWFEFDQKFNMDYFYITVVPQIQELIKYKPKYLWFDGDWKITQKTVKKEIDLICKFMIEKGIIVNDRGSKNFYSYNVFSDRFIPDKSLDISWQHVNTIGYSWGYNKDDQYKTSEQIIRLFQTVKKLNGDFLINLGPKGNGDIVEPEKNAIISLGKYIKNL